MSSFLENSYDVLLEPKTAMRSIAAWKLTRQGLLAVAVSLFVMALLTAVALQNMDLGGNWVLVIATVQFALGLLLWLMSTAVLSFVAEFFGGQGNARGLLACLGFAHLPNILSAPLWAALLVLPAGIGIVVFLLGWLGLICWSLLLVLAAIQGTHGLSFLRALLVLLTPLAVLLLLAVTGCIVLGIALSFSLGQIFGG